MAFPFLAAAAAGAQLLQGLGSILGQPNPDDYKW